MTVTGVLGVYTELWMDVHSVQWSSAGTNRDTHDFFLTAETKSFLAWHGRPVAMMEEDV